MDNQPTQPKQTTVAPTVTKPIEVAKETIAEAGKQVANAGIKKEETEANAELFIPKKEVKPVAEVKDPKGMFDYTDCQTHVVKEGEALFDVAQQYHVAMQQLRYFNHVNKATMRIKTGQALYIPKEPVYVPTGK